MCDYRKTLERFNTQPPEGGCGRHSLSLFWPQCFNTQPPEGGCALSYCFLIKSRQKFQHTAARRRLQTRTTFLTNFVIVSTHSRPKAAAAYHLIHQRFNVVSTHSRPKAAANGT